MKDLLNKISVPISGLMLGLAEAGNLVSSQEVALKTIFGAISALILALILIKIASNPRAFKGDLDNPAVAGVASTFPMGIIVLSTYVNSFFPAAAYAMWIAGILMQFAIVILFTWKFIFNFNINKVFPCYFVVYVGIAVGSIVAPIFNAEDVGMVLFWFGFISYLILLPVMLYRVFVVKSFPEPAIPTLTIFAAPSSICLAGYLSSFNVINMNLFWVLVISAVIMFFAVLLYMPKMLKLKFYPSYSAFAFPLVISAIAMQYANSFLANMNIEIPLLQYVGYFEELLAVLFVVYVLVHYANFLFGDYKKTS
ncbi:MULTISPECIES: TDT family transporter [Methanobacterium]|jgi:exfoliative toxin A/B|uniref:TDT family transporter n=1 Tax=Methanobacterium veterum TaxID=408577 RepID=A0A9E5A7Z5_9EURY|nr:MULTISPECIES: TDT family transporter [Methanobacterium]MCZ3366816.1 TDT family transporter [Methanobacterium veterum]MCZ3374037.1 TDT family transporter [Methanobacterium veterum]